MLPAIFNSPQNSETSGFVSIISKKGLVKGQYEVGIRVTNDKLHKEAMEYMDRVFAIEE